MISAWSCSRFDPVRREFFLPPLQLWWSGWLCVKHFHLTLTVTDVISVKSELNAKCAERGEYIPEQTAKMLLTLGCYYLTLASFQVNKRFSKILDCLFRILSRKKERENMSLQADLITPKAKVQWSQCACSTHRGRLAIECSWWWRCNITIKVDKRYD